MSVIKSLTRMLRRSTEDRIMRTMPEEQRAADAKEQIRREALETVDHAAKVTVQQVKAEHKLADLKVEREKMRIAMNRALKGGNDAQARQLAGQIRGLDKQMEPVKEQLRVATEASEEATAAAQLRVDEMAIRMLEVDQYLSEAHLVAIKRQLQQDRERTAGLLEDRRNPALESLKQQAERGRHDVEARERVLNATLGAAASRISIERAARDEEIDEILAEARAELGLGPKMLPPGDRITDEEAAEMFKGITDDKW